MKTILWSNEYDSIQAIYDDLKSENYYELEETELWDLAHEYNNENLDDLRMELDYEVDERIITIADLGLWDGRRQAYKTGTYNLSSVLYSEHDTLTIGLDAYNLVGREVHHDGVNYYTYRMLKPNLSKEQVDNFYDLLYNGKATRKHITYYTKSLKPYIDKIFHG